MQTQFQMCDNLLRTPSPADWALRPGTRFVRRDREYRIVKTIGQGGFGITYLADMYLPAEGRSSRVVMKEHFIGNWCQRDRSGAVQPVYEVGLFRRWLDSFRNHEARRLMSLRHPNIIRALDYFSCNGTAYYVMPYCGSAGSLAARAQAIRGSRSVLIHYLGSLLSALVYLQDLNIVHRDIKPSNIILDREGRALLIDFGTSRPMYNYQHGASVYIRTPGYSPPEHESSMNYDIYSLGMLFKNILLDNMGRQMREVSSIRLESQPNLRAAFGAPLLAMIDRAAELDRNKRWQNARQWWDALQQLVGPGAGSGRPAEGTVPVRRGPGCTGPVPNLLPVALLFLLLLCIVIFLLCR